MSKNIIQENRQPLIVGLFQLVHNYLPNVYVDRTFQRRACWSLEQKQEFIENLLKQHEAGTFSFADVQSGIQRSKLENHASSLSKYEEVQSASSCWVSLDAQNRGVALDEYYSGKFGITTSLFINGQKFELIDAKYADLDPVVKSKLDNTQMIVVIFNSFLYDELSSIFSSVNAGLPPVDQELRNAFNTWVSVHLLDYAEGTYKDVLDRVVKPDDVLRMGDVELLLKVLSTTHKNFQWTSTDSKTLDRFYNLGVSKTRNSVPEYHQTHMQRFHKIMELVTSILKSPTHKNLQKKSGGLPNQMFWATVIVAEYMVDNKLQFKSGSAAGADAKIYELDRELQSTAERDRAAAMQLFQSGKLPDEPSRKDYYDAWVSLPHQSLATGKRKQELIAAFMKKHGKLLQPTLIQVSVTPKAASNA